MTNLLLAIVLLAVTTCSPYAGQQTRGIKALDAATISALKRGEGHGMALVAELNHYPGPRHVLAMRDHLDLTPVQVRAIEAIDDDMHSHALAIGSQILVGERALDKAFAAKAITEKQLQLLTARIAYLNGRLRDIHLDAHIATRRVLTKEQIDMYDQMRGYGGGGSMPM